MKAKNKRVFLLFWIAFAIYITSLILPYETHTCDYGKGEPEIKVVSGIELTLPLFSLVSIIPLIILIYIKHNHITRWLSIILSFSLVFPMIPFLFFITTLSIFCDTNTEIGVYIYSVASILFLIAMIIKFRIPVERKMNANTVDVLDDFM